MRISELEREVERLKKELDKANQLNLYYQMVRELNLSLRYRVNKSEVDNKEKKKNSKSKIKAKDESILVIKPDTINKKPKNNMSLKKKNKEVKTKRKLRNPGNETDEEIDFEITFEKFLGESVPILPPL